MERKKYKTKTHSVCGANAKLGKRATMYWAEKKKKTNLFLVSMAMARCVDVDIYCERRLHIAVAVAEHECARVYEFKYFGSRRRKLVHCNVVKNFVYCLAYGPVYFFEKIGWPNPIYDRYVW